jgi:hypothetical protein
MKLNVDNGWKTKIPQNSKILSPNKQGIPQRIEVMCQIQRPNSHGIIQCPPKNSTNDVTMAIPSHIEQNSPLVR